MAIDVNISKSRKLQHQFTEISFLLKKKHKITVELIGGLFLTRFILWVDDTKIFNKNLFTLLIQPIRYSFKIEDIDCSIKYIWFSGPWFGHVYIDGKSVI
jgi:hypothetical protein